MAFVRGPGAARFTLEFGNDDDQCNWTVAMTAFEDQPQLTLELMWGDKQFATHTFIVNKADLLRLVEFIKQDKQE